MEQNPVTGVKISSVVPATVTGNNKQHNLTAMDLAVKLHYVRSVYFFKTSLSLRNFTIDDFKKPMFRLLEIFHPPVSGRVRRSESDDPTRRKPYIRCNDSGVRVVEAAVDGFTVEEWLAVGDRSIDHQYLVYDQVLGPDLGFSPLLVLQMTRFKCGGISIGLNWAHVLGDAFSASAFMNILGLIRAGQELPKPVHPEITESKSPVREKLFSIKKIEPVGDYWLPTKAKCKMARQTFRLSSKQVEHLMMTYAVRGKTFSDVEILYAVIWKSLLNVRKGSGPKTVTICDGRVTATCSNDDMVVSVVEIGGQADEDTEVARLAALIAEEKVVENGTIKETFEKDGGVSDFILYGANLTFVNMDGVDLYGFELNGEKPEFVNYTIHGVGDGGVVLVFPGSEQEGEFAKVITMVLPEEQLAKLKDGLRNDWNVI